MRSKYSVSPYLAQILLVTIYSIIFGNMKYLM